MLEDNLRSPSGVSYVMENRRTMARVFPNLFATHRVRAVGDYSSHLLRALRNAAATNEADPTVVVLTPGVYNSAYFEHSLLARQMGVELVEGRDLFCRDNTVYMRTTEGERQVDVIYRRIDDDYLDPMQFRPDSVLGVAGVLNAARAGNVVISSAVGNGVGDDKLVYTYVPTIIEYYLGEKPLLANVDTFRCWLDEEREEVLDRVDELVIKPVEGSGGYGIVFGPDASEKELATITQEDPHDPRGWIAQPVVQLSTVPTQIGDELAPRHVDLRPFAVNDGDDVWVLPGGLTRVALPEGSLVVNSSQGGGSKDTWVLASRASAADRELAAAEVVRCAAEGRQERKSEKNGDGPSSAAAAAAVAIGRQQTAAAATAAAGGDATDAGTQRGIAVLDRPLRRTRRRHRPHPRRHGAPTARGLQRRPRPRVADAAAGCSGIEPPEAALDVWSLTDLVAFSRDTRAAARSSTRSRRPARMPAAHARSRPPRSGSASTPPTTRWPSASAPPNASGRTSSCPTSRAARRCSPGWPTRRCPATTATGSWCWAARSNAST